MALSLRGRVLPDDEERTIYLDGDRITFDPVPGAELVHRGGWLLPGLVDVHTHPGAHAPGDPLDDDVLAAQTCGITWPPGSASSARRASPGASCRPGSRRPTTLRGS